MVKLDFSNKKIKLVMSILSVVIVAIVVLATFILFRQNKKKIAYTSLEKNYSKEITTNIQKDGVKTDDTIEQDDENEIENKDIVKIAEDKKQEIQNITEAKNINENLQDETYREIKQAKNKVEETKIKTSTTVMQAKEETQNKDIRTSIVRQENNPTTTSIVENNNKSQEENNKVKQETKEKKETEDKAKSEMEAKSKKEAEEREKLQQKANNKKRAFTTAYIKENTSIENEIISKIKNFKDGSIVTRGNSSIKNTCSYNSQVADAVSYAKSLGMKANWKVYVEEEYRYDSTGETAQLYERRIYVDFTL